MTSLQFLSNQLSYQFHSSILHFITKFLGTKRFELHKYAKKTLGTGDMLDAVSNCIQNYAVIHVSN